MVGARPVTMHNHVPFSKQNIQVHLCQEPPNQLLSQCQSDKQQDLFCTQTQLLSISVLQDNNALKILQQEKNILIKQNELWGWFRYCGM